MQEDDIVFEEGENEAPEAKLKALREKLKRCQTEKDDYLDGWQRAKADLVNLRKNTEAELAEKAKDANRALILSLLPVVDSFDMAMKGDAWDAVDERWKNGAIGIYQQLMGVLKHYGAEAFDPQGMPFDPKLHEPLRMVPHSNGHEPHTVVETYQRGFTLNGKVIRPAKVAVSEDA